MRATDCQTTNADQSFHILALTMPRRGFTTQKIARSVSAIAMAALVAFTPVQGYAQEAEGRPGVGRDPRKDIEQDWRKNEDEATRRRSEEERRGREQVIEKAIKGDDPQKLLELKRDMEKSGVDGKTDLQRAVEQQLKREEAIKKARSEEEAIWKEKQIKHAWDDPQNQKEFRDKLKITNEAQFRAYIEDVRANPDSGFVKNISEGRAAYGRVEKEIGDGRGGIIIIDNPGDPKNGGTIMWSRNVKQRWGGITMYMMPFSDAVKYVQLRPASINGKLWVCEL